MSPSVAEHKDARTYIKTLFLDTCSAERAKHGPFTKTRHAPASRGQSGHFNARTRSRRSTGAKTPGPAADEVTDSDRLLNIRQGETSPTPGSLRQQNVDPKAGKPQPAVVVNGKAHGIDKAIPGQCRINIISAMIPIANVFSLGEHLAECNSSFCQQCPYTRPCRTRECTAVCCPCQYLINATTLGIDISGGGGQPRITDHSVKSAHFPGV